MTISKTIPDNAPVPGTYRHYKGHHYQVLGMARHSETEEWLVVYRALYAEQGFWLRPLTIWLDPVITRSDDAPGSSGHSKPTRARFELIETSNQSLTELTK